MPSPIALVTGASSGLGAGLARYLAREGFRVALVARRTVELTDVAEDIESAGGEALVLTCDVTVQTQVRAAVARCREHWGPVDLLVCNAGVSTAADARAFAASEIARLVAVNLLGAAYAVEEVLPEMLARDAGHLVAVGSLAGYGGLPQTAAYSASKGALHNLFESLRLDLRGTGVDVTLITPGWVRTPLTDKNEHPMPFLMELDEAVERMARAIRRRRALSSFPMPLALAVWAGRLLPRGLYDAVAARLRRSKRGP